METERQIPTFFAKLLNGPSIDQLTESDWRARAEELVSLLQPYVQRKNLPLETADKTRLLFLQKARKWAETFVRPLLNTGEVTWNPRNAQELGLRLLDPPRVIYRLEHGIVREDVQSPTLNDGLLKLFSTCLHQKPFPFSRCPVCGTVFVRSGRGKPRRYCTDTCRTKGVPSATKKTEYMRQYRQNLREREQTLANRVMKQTDSEQERLALLSEAFRKQGKMKNRRQLLFLLKRAGQAA